MPGFGTVCSFPELPQRFNRGALLVRTEIFGVFTTIIRNYMGIVVIWDFPKIRVPYFGVLIIRILLFRVPYGPYNRDPTSYGAFLGSPITETSIWYLLRPFHCSFFVELLCWLFIGGGGRRRPEGFTRHPEGAKHRSHE